MNRKSLISRIKTKDPTFRRAFRGAQVRRRIAAQIKALRSAEDRHWSQADLGNAAGMKQNAIARLENPNYDGHSVRTLLRIADAYDVGLVVEFVPFSELVHRNQTANERRLTPASIHNDLGLGNRQNNGSNLLNISDFRDLDVYEACSYDQTSNLVSNSLNRDRQDFAGAANG